MFFFFLYVHKKYKFFVYKVRLNFEWTKNMRIHNNNNNLLYLHTQYALFAKSFSTYNNIIALRFLPDDKIISRTQSQETCRRRDW